MGVPAGLEVAAAREDLHVANAALDEASRHQRLAAEVVGGFLADPVEALGGFGLGADVDGLRGTGLHAVGELVGVGARRQLGVEGVELGVALVHLVEHAQPALLIVGGAGRGRLEVDDRYRPVA